MMNPISFGWMSFSFLMAAGAISYFLDKRCYGRDIVSSSIVVQIISTMLAFNQDAHPALLAGYIVLIESFLAFYLWKQKEYNGRKFYVTLIMVSVIMTTLWGFDSYWQSGLIYNENEPSAFTFMSSILTTLQGVTLLINARGKRGDTISGRLLCGRAEPCDPHCPARK
jgi:uncharacterized membrane protein